MTPSRLIEPARLAGAALLRTQSDERLVDLTRAGNDRAFEAIVTRYRKPLLHYCGNLLPPERAEDAVQQAFLNAYTAIGAGEAKLKLRPWLYRVAHNASLNLVRQNGWSYDQIPEDFDGVMQPPQAVEQSERIREVVRAVKDLPERQRDAIVLRELEGRSYEEISVALGVTGGAVRQLLNRGRTTLRAAATAITPQQLLERFADRVAADAPAASRIAELTVGAGGAMTLAKVGAAVVVAGAVAGGVATGPLHHPGSRRGAADTAEAARVTVASAGLAGGAGASLSGRGTPGARGPHATTSGVARLIALGRQGVSLRSAPGVRGGHGSGGKGGSGSSGSSSGGDRSGSGGGDRSGSGSSGSDSGSSGSGHDGSGSTGSGSSDGSSGPGSSGSDGSGSSGSGSDGSGSSGSGPDGSGSSGSGSDGSGSSGSGSDGSGSDGSGSSGSGSIGSGLGDSLSGDGGGHRGPG